MSGAGRTRVGAYGVCLDDERRILLCRIGPSSPEPGSWTLPGGGLDFGESPEAGAIREIEEESGFVAELDGIAGTYSEAVPDSPEGGPLHVIGIIFRGRLLDGSLRPEENGSTDLCDWFTESDARQLPLVALARRGLELAYGGDGG